MKRKFITFVCSTLMLAGLLSLSGCRPPPPTPIWDKFSDEILAEHKGVLKCNLFIYNGPAFSVDLTVDNVDLEEKKQIAQKIIMFVLSDDAYPEMLKHFNIKSRGMVALKSFISTLSRKKLHQCILSSFILQEVNRMRKRLKARI